MVMKSLVPKVITLNDAQFALTKDVLCVVKNPSRLI